MKKYFPSPFPFHNIIHKKQRLDKLNLEDSIRDNIRSLILMRVGEFEYDKKMGFAIWDFDNEVFYHEKEPYYEKPKKDKGLLVKTNAARKYFKDNLQKMIIENEIRLNVGTVKFSFEKVDGSLSVYQKKIAISVTGRIKSTGKNLKPPFTMGILYAPFQIETK